MSQSLTRIYIHMVFHVRNNRLHVRNEDKKELYAYMGSIIKDNESIPIMINGTGDHIHILCIMSKNITLAKLTEEVKRHSSRWIKTKGEYYRNFAWQGGYGGFSVSPSLHDIVKKYIENQEVHHKKKSFKEEYIDLLREYSIDYKEQYLWND